MVTPPVCRAEGRETVIAYSVLADGEGEAWARSLGFARVTELARQTLSIREADPAAWQVRPPEGFRTTRRTAAAPQEVVADYARARNAMRDAPASSLAIPDWTVERIRRYEADAVERGSVLHTAVVVHEDSGAVVALTETEIHRDHVDLVLQQDTVVLPEFRGRGLGRVVKAAMMRGLTAEHPGATHVITNTAASNRYMIRVNEQLGYATDHVLVDLGIGLDALQRRIASR
jgi:mycothiol synthase